MQEIDEIREDVLSGIDYMKAQNCLKRKEADRLKSFIRSLNEAELIAIVSSAGGVGVTLLESQGVAVRVPMPASWD